MSCRTYGGRGVLWLPFPNPPKTKPDPMPWPKDAWKALLLCPECKRFRIHKKEDIRWRERTAADYAGYLEHTVWFCVKFECVGLGCGTPAELHVLAYAGKPIQEVDSMLRSEDVEGTLPCGHLIEVLKSQGLVKEGDLAAYDALISNSVSAQIVLERAVEGQYLELADNLDVVTGLHRSM